MKIVVASDSHGNVDAIEHIFQNEKFDYFIFCGDGVDDFSSFYFDARLNLIAGNCDWFCRYPSEQTIILNNRKIFVTHGHKYYVKNSIEKLVKEAKNIGAEIVLYGHTHRQKFENIDGIFFVNPGTLKLGQYAIVEIQETGVPIFEQKAI